ncbi:hypothetical protein DFQ28_010516 [Apophysomyces sp. BC1034]|nr:hypothetical protein DFQ30_010031 [Apophysomyces sp. BC1015]KAG0171109.1 hypothetical protein DFQ29_008983 [Apophysomyces sp. BC1021]KAG0184775.1 hypothetical protein DFQ28_010516 [Apophysomyces sp. BC1034]
MDTTVTHQNFEPIQIFLIDWHVRVTWIAFLTLWVFWGAAWFTRHAFGGDEIALTPTSTHPVVAPTTTAGEPSADPEAPGNKRFAPAWGTSIWNRLIGANDLLRDLVLMLLSVLTINTFARASTRAVMILAWIYVALAFVVFFIETAVQHRFLRLFYSLVFYAICLAIIGLAYAEGFY